MLGVWVNADGRRGSVTVDQGELVFEEPAPEDGAFDHFHLDDPNMGGLTVWCWESRQEGSALNLFVVALVASCGGGVRPIVGPAFVTGPMDEAGDFTGLTEGQVEALLGAASNVAWGTTEAGDTAPNDEGGER